jgi:Zn-dependent protease with chaperone function
MNFHKTATLCLLSLTMVSALAMPLVLAATKTKTIVKPSVIKSLVVLTPKEDMHRLLHTLIDANNLYIADAVVDASDIQDTNVVNAYTDGTKVIITSALWNKLKNDDARAFVLAHELGHITNHHIAKGIAKRVGLNVVHPQSCRKLWSTSGNRIAGFKV